MKMTRRARLRTVLLGAAVAAGTLSYLAVPATSSAAAPVWQPPPVGHVFVINLENEGFATTFGAKSPAPYLAKTLRSQGNLLTQYYGIGHNSLDNYIAQISGQAPNPQTQGDCQVYTNFTAAPVTAANGQVAGTGCVYPSSVKTIADQLTAVHKSWRGYMESMGSDPTREANTCGRPAPNSQDKTQSATAKDEYAARHNPFVYFHSLIDSGACQQNDVRLSQLLTDLTSISTTRSLSYITPNLCDDGHDSPCADGRPGGLVSANGWLQTWVPRILASPAYKKDGLLIVTFDESDGPESDSTACCGETAGPNSPVPGIDGQGGGRVGAVLVSRFIKPNSTTNRAYNHYSLLASIEKVMHVPFLGFAGKADLPRFGRDVYTAT